MRTVLTNEQVLEAAREARQAMSKLMNALCSAHLSPELSRELDALQHQNTVENVIHYLGVDIRKAKKEVG